MSKTGFQFFKIQLLFLIVCFTSDYQTLQSIKYQTECHLVHQSFQQQASALNYLRSCPTTFIQDMVKQLQLTEGMNSCPPVLEPSTLTQDQSVYCCDQIPQMCYCTNEIENKILKLDRILTTHAHKKVSNRLAITPLKTRSVCESTCLPVIQNINISFKSICLFVCLTVFPSLRLGYVFPSLFLYPSFSLLHILILQYFDSKCSGQ